MECKVSKEKRSVACVKLYHEECLRRNSIELPRYKKDFICPFCTLQALVSPNDISHASHDNAADRNGNDILDGTEGDCDGAKDDCNDDREDPPQHEDELNTSEAKLIAPSNEDNKKIPRFMRRSKALMLPFSSSILFCSFFMPSLYSFSAANRSSFRRFISARMLVSSSFASASCLLRLLAPTFLAEAPPPSVAPCSELRHFTLVSRWPSSLPLQLIKWSQHTRDFFLSTIVTWWRCSNTFKIFSSKGGKLPGSLCKDMSHVAKSSLDLRQREHLLIFGILPHIYIYITFTYTLR